MMACFDQKSCMNNHSPQNTNTQTAGGGRALPPGIVGKLNVRSNHLFDEQRRDVGGFDNLTWNPIFLS